MPRKEKKEGNIAFRKIGGKIIPIAVGIGTYAAFRKFRPSSFASINRIRQAAKKGGVSVPIEPTDIISKGFERLVHGFPVNKKRAVSFNIDTIKFVKGAKHTINSPKQSFLLDRPEFFSHMFKGKSLRTKSVEEALAGGFKNRNYILKEKYGSLRSLKDFPTRRDIIKKTRAGKRVLRKKGEWIAQEKLKFKKEYRVHALNEKVIGISYRRIPNKKLRKGWEKLIGYPGGGAFVPVVNLKKRKQIKDFVQKAIEGSTLSKITRENRSFFAGYDVGETAKSFRLIEANTAPGTLANPIINRQVYREITGRWGKDVAGAAAVSAGTITNYSLGRKNAKASRKGNSL